MGPARGALLSCSSRAVICNGTEAWAEVQGRAASSLAKVQHDLVMPAGVSLADTNAVNRFLVDLAAGQDDTRRGRNTRSRIRAYFQHTATAAKYRNRRERYVQHMFTKNKPVPHTYRLEKVDRGPVVSPD